MRKAVKTVFRWCCDLGCISPHLPLGAVSGSFCHTDHMTAACGPTSLPSPLENATSDRQGGRDRHNNTELKMLALINRLLDWFRSLFWKEEMELTLVGLQYSGKTTFVNVIAVSPQLLATVLMPLALIMG